MKPEILSSHPIFVVTYSHYTEDEKWIYLPLFFCKHESTAKRLSEIEHFSYNGYFFRGEDCQVRSSQAYLIKGEDGEIRLFSESSQFEKPTPEDLEQEKSKKLEDVANTEKVDKVISVLQGLTVVQKRHEEIAERF